MTGPVLSELIHSMSVTADSVEDAMIAAASVPSLAALVKAGKSSGLIQPIMGYTATG